jgi:predicted alpha/beta hydrolase
MAYATPDNVYIDDIILPAVDGFPLAGTLFLARGRKTHSVLINSAAGVSRQAYRDFAAYLASRGAAVLTYDYRGVGESRPRPKPPARRASLKGFKADLADWAARDVTAAVAWMRGRYKDLPLGYIGHSFGGEALGLIPNNSDVSRALLIASHFGYWKLIQGPERYRRYLMQRLLGIPAARLLGYLPGKLGLGEDLPRDAYLQWARWSGNPRYLFGDGQLPALGNFANFDAPLRALCFNDDPWATRDSVELFCREFTATEAQVIAVDPANVGAAAIGHSGFFSPEMRDPLWRGAAEWLEADALPQISYRFAARA